MRYRFVDNIIFCPKCGVQSLLRDYDYSGNEPGQSQHKNGTDWWCTGCGFNFHITKSRKWHIADELHRRDRQQRVGKPSEGTNPAIRDAFVRFLEKQPKK